MDKNNASDYTYAKEYEIINNAKETLVRELGTEELRKELTQMVDFYSKLLNESVKIAKISDRLQKKLVSANEKIEIQKEELRAALDKVEMLSRTDMLTEISNRRDILEKIGEEISRSKRLGTVFSIIMIDIDHFKQFNDTYGHDCGDYVLKSVAEVLKKSVREHDRPSRWGGEEFLVVLPDTYIDGADIFAERVRDKIAKMDLGYNNLNLKITATFGIAQYNENKSFDEMLKSADEALYTGKRNGRNVVVMGR